MAFFGSRLRRVEAVVRKGPGGRCPECRLPPDGPGYIVLSDSDNSPDDPDELCSRCGRRLWTVITIVYDEPGPEFIETEDRGEG